MRLKTLLWFTMIFTYQQVSGQKSKDPYKALEEKVDLLVEATSKKPIMVLNYEKFKQFVQQSPRSYSFIVMFTALAPSRQCTTCEYVHNEFQIVANSFKYSPHNKDHRELFFGIVDYDAAPEVFHVQNLKSAPVIKHFGPVSQPTPKKKGLKKDVYNFETLGFQAETIAKWIEEVTDVKIDVFRPPDYSGILVFTLLFILIGGFLYLRRNNLQFLYNKQLWAIMAVSLCFAMVSGQMWNQIRGPPFYHKTANGPVYINGGSHSQFVLETYFVAIINAAIVVGMILTIEALGGIKGTDNARQKESKSRAQAIVGVVIVCVFFSLLLSVFRIKTPGYPYSFLFK